MGLSIDLFRVATRNMAARKAPNHRRLTSTIIVGYHEQHEVTYDLNHWESVHRVYVDRQLIIEEAMLTHFTRVKTLSLMVGYQEQHRVTIEFEMNTLHGDYGQKTLRMLVDDQLISTVSV